MKRSTISINLLAVLILVGCSKAEEPGATQSVLFEDSMAENWQANWFLDGQKATLEHRDGGLAFLTEESGVDKRIDRGPFDSQHAVLWTRESFEGDIRITYKYTRLPGSTYQKLIYVHAQGIGEGPYVKDIYAWKDRRKVAVMGAYFNYMDLIGLSMRDQIRCKRYPWFDREGEAYTTEIRPRAEHDGWPVDRELAVVLEKRRESLYLHITDTVSGETFVEHTWDLTDEDVLERRDPKHVEAGRIGIRQMGGHKIVMRDFRVERL